jgi:hypothetical protein
VASEQCFLNEILAGRTSSAGLNRSQAARYASDIFVLYTRRRDSVIEVTGV